MSPVERFALLAFCGAIVGAVFAAAKLGAIVGAALARAIGL